MPTVDPARIAELKLAIGDQNLADSIDLLDWAVGASNARYSALLETFPLQGNQTINGITFTLSATKRAATTGDAALQMDITIPVLIKGDTDPGEDTGAGDDVIAAEAAILKKIRQMKRGAGGFAIATTVCLWFRVIGASNYVYWTCFDAEWQPILLRQASEIARVGILTLHAYPHAHGDPITDPSSKLLIPTAPTYFRDTLGGDTEALLRAYYLDQSTEGQQQRLTFLTRHADGMGASDFTFNYVVTPVSPGVDDVNAAAYNGHAAKVSAVPATWTDIGGIPSAAGAFQSATEADVWVLGRDTAVPAGQVDNLTGTVTPGAGLLGSGDWDGCMVALDASGNRGPVSGITRVNVTNRSGSSAVTQLDYDAFGNGFNGFISIPTQNVGSGTGGIAVAEIVPGSAEAPLANGLHLHAKGGTTGPSSALVQRAIPLLPTTLPSGATGTPANKLSVQFPVKIDHQSSGDASVYATSITITKSGTVSGGTFTVSVTFGGIVYTTANIDYNPLDSDVATALQAAFATTPNGYSGSSIPNLPSSPATIFLTNGLTQSVSAVSIDSSLLTGGGTYGAVLNGTSLSDATADWQIFLSNGGSVGIGYDTQISKYRIIAPYLSADVGGILAGFDITGSGPLGDNFHPIEFLFDYSTEPATVRAFVDGDIVGGFNIGVASTELKASPPVFPDHLLLQAHTSTGNAHEVEYDIGRILVEDGYIGVIGNIAGASIDWEGDPADNADTYELDYQVTPPGGIPSGWYSLNIGSSPSYTLAEQVPVGVNLITSPPTDPPVVQPTEIRIAPSLSSAWRGDYGAAVPFRVGGGAREWRNAGSYPLPPAVIPQGQLAPPWYIAAQVQNTGSATAPDAYLEAVMILPHDGDSVTVSAPVVLTRPALWQVDTRADERVSVLVFDTGVLTDNGNCATDANRTDGADIPGGFGLYSTGGGARLRGPIGLITPTQGWLSFRLAMGFDSGSSPGGSLIVWEAYDSSSKFIQLRYNCSSGNFELERKNTTSSVVTVAANAFVTGDKFTLVASWTASHLYLSVNGSTFASIANALIPTLSATTFDIGSHQGASLWIASRVLWAGFGTGTLIQADVAAVEALGDAAPPWDSYGPASALTAWWDARTVRYATGTLLGAADYAGQLTAGPGGTMLATIAEYLDGDGRYIADVQHQAGTIQAQWRRRYGHARGND